LTFGEAGCVGEGEEGEQSDCEQVGMHDEVIALFLFCFWGWRRRAKESRKKGYVVIYPKAEVTDVR